VGNGGGGELDGVPAGVEDGGVVGDEDVDAVDVGGGATRSGRRRGPGGGGAPRRRGERRRGDEDDGAAASGEERAASRRRGGDEDDGAASRRRGSGVGRGEGKGIEGEGTILMAHHPSVRHKYIHTNGAPHPGAPLVFFFDFCSSQQVIFHLT